MVRRNKSNLLNIYAPDAEDGGKKERKKEGS